MYMAQKLLNFCPVPKAAIFRATADLVFLKKMAFILQQSCNDFGTLLQAATILEQSFNNPGTIILKVQEQSCEVLAIILQQNCNYSGTIL